MQKSHLSLAVGPPYVFPIFWTPYLTLINCLTESTHCGGHVSSWIELQEQIANVPKVVAHRIILYKIGRDSSINVQHLKDAQVRHIFRMFPRFSRLLKHQIR